MIKLINPLDDLSRYPLDERGIGNAFADSYKNMLRFVPETKCWYHYNGVCWKPDTADMKVRESAKEYLAHLEAIANEAERAFLMHLEANAGEAEKAKKSDVKDEEGNEGLLLKPLVGELAKNSARKKMIDEAKSVHPLPLTAFDKHKGLLNVQNGTIELDTCKLRAHDPNDFITRVAAVDYDKKAKCLRWQKFTNEIMCGFDDLIAYLQKILGYGITGETTQESLFIFYGPTTRNGKGTLMESILNVLGDYGINMQPDSLAKRKSFSGSYASPDIARNAGVRFINVNEPADDMALDVAKVKQLTGSDTVTARFLYGNPFDYIPQFKLFISTNHLPIVTDDSVFTSGRIKVIPFNRHFQENEQDKNLKSLFRTEESKSAILNWLLGGLMLYRQEGLEVPPKVVEATLAYRQTADTVGAFIEGTTSKKADADPIKTSLLYPQYQKWCVKEGLTPLNQRAFVGGLRKTCDVTRDGALGNVVRGLEISAK